MEDKIIQDTLQDIAVEIESFLNLFKSQVQFEISIQKQYIDHASMESHNNFVEKNFETRWEMIKTLVYLLAKHLKDEKVENALETHVPQIDAIRDFLVKKHSPFRDHEYQLPFHTLRLLKALKSCVAKDQQKEERPVMEMERKQTVMDKAKFFQDEISRVAGSPKKLPNLPKKKPEQKKQVLAMFDEALIDMKTGQEPLTSVLLVETPSTVGPTEKLYRPQIKKLVQDQQVTIDDMSALEKELFSLLPDMVSEEVEFRVGAKGEVISQALVPEDLPEEKEKQVVVAEGPLSDLVNANQALSSRRREIRKTMMLGDFSLMQQLTAQFANMTEEFVPGHAKSDSQSTIMKPEPKFYRPTETMTQVVEEEPKVPKKPAPILPNKEARSSVNKPMSPKLASPGLKAAPLLQDVQRLSLSKPGLEEGRSSETKSPTKKAPVLPPKTKPLPPPKPASHSGFPSLPPTPSHTQSVVEVKPVAPFVQEVKPETPSAVEAKPETASTVEVKQDTQPVQEQVKEAPSVVEQVKETQAATEVKEAPKEEVHDVVQETVKTVVEPAQVVEAVTEPANERQQPQVEQPLVETSREQEPVIEQQVEPQIEQSQESVHVHHSVDTITQSVETMHHSAEQLNPAVPASTRQSVVQSARHSFVQPARQSVHEPVLQSVRHSVHEPVTKPVRQSVTQPVRQSMTQPQTIDPVKTETPIEQIAEAQTVTRPDLPTEDAGPSYDDQEDIMNMYQRRSTAHKDIPTFQAPSVSIDAFAPVEQEIEIRFEKQGSQSSIETVIPKKAGTLMYQPGENGSLDRNLDQRESQGADDSQEESQQTQEQTVEAQPEQTVLAASAEQLNPDMYDDILTDYGRKVSQVIRQSMLAKQIRMSRPPEPNPPLPIDQAASQESSRPVSEIHILAPLDLEPLQAIKTSPQDVLLFSPEEISTLFTSLASAKVEEEKPKIPEPPVTKTVAFVRDSQPEQKGDPTATVFPATSIFDPDHGDYSNVINEKDLEQPPVVSGIDILAVELCPVKNEFQILMIPLNAMFDFCVYSLGKPLRLGRNNTEGRPNFKAYGTLVVSRNHAEIYVNDGMVYIKDIGSNSGTFRNNARLSQPGQVSPEVPIFTGDYIQMGRDYVGEEVQLDQDGRIPSRKRCVKFQVVIVPPNKVASECVLKQAIPIEQCNNKSGYAFRGLEIFSCDDKPLVQDQLVVDSPEPEKKPSPTPQKRISIVRQPEQKETNVKRTTFVLQTIQSGTKSKRIQLNTADGSSMFDTNVKRWEERGSLGIQESWKDGMYYDVFLPEASWLQLKLSKKPINIQQLVGRPFQMVRDKEQLGTLTFQSEIKLEMTPQNPESPMLIITGNFKEHRFIIVQKMPSSRKQDLIGECKGKNQASKSVLSFDTLWLSTLSLDVNRMTPMVWGGLALLSAVSHAY